MISNQDFLELLLSHGVDFFTGVPDSLLKNFCAYITDTVDEDKHIINCNEGAAIALAAGYHLGTGKIPMVYLQNSGLGNTVNPLLSLADEEVYSIPMLLLIGWRGEPGVKDEPQHIKQGRVQNKMLETMEIPYLILDGDTKDYKKRVAELLQIAKSESKPVAVVIRKDTFEEYKLSSLNESEYPMSREEALFVILESLRQDDLVVSSTGMISREIYEIREKLNQGHQNDFLTVGSMGHCSQIALGIAISRPERKIYCIDGDGALIMHMGSLAIIGSKLPKNLNHIVLNNGVHDSVGGQPTVGYNMDLMTLAKSVGYQIGLQIQDKKELKLAFSQLSSSQKTLFAEILVRPGSRGDLGRPKTSALENKRKFMDSLFSK